jgi:hypothetical protein
MEIAGLGDVSFSLPNTRKSKEAGSGVYVGLGGVHKWLREKDFSFFRQGLDNLIVCYDKCLNKFRSYVEKQRTDVQRYPYAFLVSA